MLVSFLLDGGLVWFGLGFCLFVFQLDTEKKHQFRKCLYRNGLYAICGVFSSLMVDMGRPRQLWAVPPLGRWSWAV